MKKRTVCLFKMMKERNNRNSVEPEMPHKCGLYCLGPLTFHHHAVGDKVRLSQGCRLAKRQGSTFKNGLVFSNRTIKIQERIRLRVEKNLVNWHGALRVGFTTVSPSSRTLPLPLMAIPNLTDKPGHWAAPVPESFCQAGSELEFWVSHGGSIYVSNNNRKHKLFTGVDLSKPLWAMIDIYGQTCSIFLLGSEKEGLCTRRSCPAPNYPPSPVNNCHSFISDGNRDECISRLDMQVQADEGSGTDCVVCMGRAATVALPCGHRCLCNLCVPRVIQEFGICPLCRYEIIAPSVEES